MKITALNIAKYIVSYCITNGISITHLKLQKLLYIVWVNYYQETGKPLFNENFFAWKLGPVQTEVYDEYCQFGGMDIFIDNYEGNLNSDVTNIINNSLRKYSKLDPSNLVNITHRDQTAWNKTYYSYSHSSKILWKDVIDLDCNTNVLEIKNGYKAK